MDKRKIAECVSTGRCENFSQSPKSRWALGPWQDEPDRIEFPHAGLDCLLHRGPSGAWCGYVGVKPGHPWHGVGYSTCPISCGVNYCDHRPEHRLDVHGGLTYAAACGGHICHRSAAAEPRWWFGFDCAHAGDISPAYQNIAVFTDLGEVYRDVAYVQGETERLAEQLAAIAA